MKINVLPIEIANMIAAGEVVERPASVVKELLENAIDAGATSITVEIKKGGIPYIRVTDNGCGIEKEDLAVAFKRHATSKIKNAVDLNSILTLGFRGEALASIAAVSKVEVFSKTKSSSLGSLITVEGGEVIELDDAGCPDGTTMIVRNLFFNTPARMKFLKNDKTETAYVTEVINKMILSHPEIAFQYINNGKTVAASQGDGELISSIYTVFGKDYAKNMTEVCYEEDGFKVTGFIGNAQIARKDRRHQLFFVNSRNIIARVMSAAVSEAYKNTVMTGRFPVCVLKASIDPKLVDVNVHPSKIEVRFADEKTVYNMVYWAVKNALTDKKYIPEIEINKKQETGSFERGLIKNAPSYDTAKQMEINLLRDSYVKTTQKTKNNEINEEVKKDRTNPFVNSIEEKKDLDLTQKAESQEVFESLSLPQKDKKTKDTEQIIVPKKEQGEENLERFAKAKPEENIVEKKILQDIRGLTKVNEDIKKEELPRLVAGVDFLLIGQVFNTYILVQKDNEMLVIDQHAAHERLLFEELLENFKTNSVDLQLMLLPVTMTLTAPEMITAESSLDFFNQLGFEAEVFGTNSIIIRSTPGMMEEDDIKDIVSDVITLLSSKGNNITRALSEEALHMIACKKALKGKKALSVEEMKALCEDVLSLGDGINTCPHGRPIIVKISKYSMEKQFKRIL